VRCTIVGLPNVDDNLCDSRCWRPPRADDSSLAELRQLRKMDRTPDPLLLKRLFGGEWAEFNRFLFAKGIIIVIVQGIMRIV
jgi:hypothetical protein